MSVRKTGVVITAGILVLLFALASAYIGPGNIGKIPESPPSVELENPEIELILNFGVDDVATVSTTARNVFEALTNVTEVKGIPVRTKQYDFGVFVESIRDVTNTNERAWIYFVNGEAGKVAADKYELANGDLVEWRSVKPNIEE